MYVNDLRRPCRHCNISFTLATANMHEHACAKRTEPERLAYGHKIYRRRRREGR